MDFLLKRVRILSLVDCLYRRLQHAHEGSEKREKKSVSYNGEEGSSIFVQLDDVKKYSIGHASFGFSFYHNAINGTHIAAIVAKNSKWREKDTRTIRCRHLSLSCSVCHPFNCFLVWGYAQFSSVSANVAAFIPNTTEHSREMLWIWRVNRVELIATRYICWQSVVWSHSSLKKFVLARIGRQLRIQFVCRMRFPASQANKHYCDNVLVACRWCLPYRRAVIQLVAEWRAVPSWILAAHLVHLAR